MTLTYVANARIPTEKAHGYQIASMCEAFAAQGPVVTLVHPARHQPDVALRSADVHTYYGVAPNFVVRAVAGVDLVHRLRWSARLLPGLASVAGTLVWASQVADVLAREPVRDIYYTRDPTVGYALARRGLPTVFECHGIPRRAQNLTLRRLAHKSTLVLTVALTSHIRDRLTALGFPAKRVLVQGDAVDLRRFQALPTRDEARRVLGLDTEGPIVGYVGRFTARGMEKGVPELIQAVADARRATGLDVQLLGVGGPLDGVSTYMRLARAAGLPEDALRLVDRVSPGEVPLWMRACDAGTIPWSWNEFSAYFTSPLKLFEYLAAGLPVVASDLPSLRDVLTDGDNALLVPAGDTSALSAALVRVLTDDGLRSRLCLAAFGTASRYTWAARATSILAALESTALAENAS